MVQTETPENKMSSDGLRYTAKKAGSAFGTPVLGSKLGHDVMLQVRPAQAFIATGEQEDPEAQPEGLGSELPGKNLMCHRARPEGVLCRTDCCSRDPQGLPVRVVLSHNWIEETTAGHHAQRLVATTTAAAQTAATASAVV
jgi:hypothetical protein